MVLNNIVFEMLYILPENSRHDDTLLKDFKLKKEEEKITKTVTIL